MNQIRKISVGKGHPNDMMHYQVGKVVNLAGIRYEVAEILMDREYWEKGKSAHNVYIKNEDGKLLWKTLIDVPIILEYKIDFE